MYYMCVPDVYLICAWCVPVNTRICIHVHTNVGMYVLMCLHAMYTCECVYKMYV